MGLTTFGDNDFSALFGQLHDPGYAMLGADDLGDDHPLCHFVSLLAESFVKPLDTEDGINWDELLLIKVDEGGLIDRIYPPAIYKDETGNAIVKVGANAFNVQSGSFTVQGSDGKDLPVPVIGLGSGYVVGSVTWAEKPGKRTTKDSAGHEIETPYYGAWVDFAHYGASELHYYRVWVKWDKAAEVTKQKYDACIMQGRPIVDLLDDAPRGGGGGFHSLKELVTDGDQVTVDLPYFVELVAGVDHKVGRFGDEYYVTNPADGSKIRLQGKSKAQVETGTQVLDGTKLMISHAYKNERGHWMINNALLNPKAAIHPKAAIQKPESKLDLELKNLKPGQVLSVPLNEPDEIDF